jgi:hypothetical protein
VIIFLTRMSSRTGECTIDLTAEPERDEAELRPLQMEIGPYAFAPSYLESCLRPGQWLNDEVISAMVYLLCGREPRLFVDSQAMAHWLRKGVCGDAPPTVHAPRLPRFLVMNDAGVHWYVIHVEEWSQTLTAYGAWSVSSRLCSYLAAWLGIGWRSITIVATPQTGDAIRDAELRKSECGVAVCRAIADLLNGRAPRAPVPDDRTWILRTIRAGARAPVQ